jgi:hypothetical protein
VDDPGVPEVGVSVGLSGFSRGELETNGVLEGIYNCVVSVGIKIFVWRECVAEG